MVKDAAMQRRAAMQALAGWVLGQLIGCATPTEPSGTDAAVPPRDEPLLARGRSLPGGFLAPPLPGTGLPARPGTGMFVKLVAPQAVALRGNELLVLDAAGGRLWRMDVVFNTLAGIAGAPARPDSAVAIGPDGSAWVLDTDSRQVLRFARDGRLLQSHRIGLSVATPVAMALADGGQFARIYLLGGNLTGDVLKDDGFALAFLLAMALYAPISLLFWHAPALVHWHQVTPVKSIFFSLLACRQNLGAFLVFGLSWMGVSLATGMLVAIVGAAVGDAGVAGTIMMPAMMLIAAMFFTSQYFTFTDSFDFTSEGHT
ncbi:MAG: hypothetical protein CFE44_07585 [Burkholderiales bacterium PBB4]|nr:MAG: hypothetical protein CFE44_07585 [Burkholderiales bacterium PBB4]